MQKSTDETELRSKLEWLKLELEMVKHAKNPLKCEKIYLVNQFILIIAHGPVLVNCVGTRCLSNIYIRDNCG